MMETNILENNQDNIMQA